MSRLSTQIRQQVRQRAENRCEYCLMPDHLAPYGHQVDHIIPLKHDGSSTLENLAYACLRCNNSKGTDEAVTDSETGQIVGLYNPRIHNWDDHFELDGALMKSKTSVGRVTIRLLRMNHPDQMNARRELLDAGLW